MTGYMSNKEQAQALKDLWKQYGSTVLIAILVFVTVNFGWRYWKQYEAVQKGRASLAYSQLIEAKAHGKNDEVKLYAENLMKKFPRSPYASFAAMALAKEAVLANALDEAKKNLAWVIKHATSAELRELARIREARILLFENKPKEALALLQQGKKTLYLSAKDEVMGDAFLAKNDEKQAAFSYKKALGSVKIDNGDFSLTSLTDKKDKNDMGNVNAAAATFLPPSPLLKLKATQIDFVE